MFMIVLIDIDLIFSKNCSQEKLENLYSNFIWSYILIPFHSIFDTAATELFSGNCSIIGEISSNMVNVSKTKSLNVVDSTMLLCLFGNTACYVHCRLFDVVTKFNLKNMFHYLWYVLFNLQNSFFKVIVYKNVLFPKLFLNL